ncbi:MAG: aminodeoxychorismate lyase [Bacillota bacterium]|nr:aminodeoxychorismate lyase [Bacillota bacterium]
MKVGHLIATVVETIIKVVVLAVAVMFIVRGATKAYDFGYRVFADKPVSVSGGRTITVGVSENMSVKDIAAMLEEKGLIEDADLFVVQELLSAYHGEIRPGIYDLSTDMTAAQMMEIMSTVTQETQEDGIS